MSSVYCTLCSPPIVLPAFLPVRLGPFPKGHIGPQPFVPSEDIMLPLTNPFPSCLLPIIQGVSGLENKNKNHPLATCPTSSQPRFFRESPVPTDTFPRPSSVLGAHTGGRQLQTHLLLHPTVWILSTPAPLPQLCPLPCLLNPAALAQPSAPYLPF